MIRITLVLFVLPFVLGFGCGYAYEAHYLDGIHAGVRSFGEANPYQASAFCAEWMHDHREVKP